MQLAMSPKIPTSSSTLSPPSEQARLSIGNVIGLEGGEVLLPDFVALGEDGLCVSLSSTADSEQLRRFVDRVYSAGACFAGLDYEVLSKLLYPKEQAGIAVAQPAKGKQRIADGIRGISPERRDLYKGVKSLSGGMQIEYLFEPVFIERVIEVPIPGEDDNGQPHVKGHGQQALREPTKLDIDEFVAAMWLQGLRSGIDIQAVKAAIEGNGVARVAIARRIDPTPGTDAGVMEKTASLHRDDSPFVQANGRVDLSQFKNHFPQVKAGTCLLQKIPRQLGIVGYATDGSLLEPEVPRDLELEELAGFGTRIERTAKGEFLLAARDGFLNIDKATRQISIAEKIINREGVSIRTTGNLTLAGDKYEEFGEVQERRVVDGKHMSFHADVFGNILSDGGHVHLMANLCGGSVKNPNGLVQIDQRASQATIDARGGEVRIQVAEGVAIVAERVRIERAVACDIVAEFVEIDDAAACTIAARHTRVSRAGVYRDIETVVHVCIPDFSELNKHRVKLLKKIQGLDERQASKLALFERRNAVPEIKNFFSTDGRIRSGEYKLSPEQQMQWHNAAQRLAKPLLEIKSLQQDIEAIDAVLSEDRKQLAEMDALREAAATNTGCDVGQIAGGLLVQTQAIEPGEVVYPDCDASEIKRRLRDPRAIRERLFRGSSGKYSWSWSPAKE